MFLWLFHVHQILFFSRSSRSTTVSTNLAHTDKRNCTCVRCVHYVFEFTLGAITMES